MDKKLTDNEIIKVLECCVSSNGIEACKNGCPFYEKEICLEDGMAIEKYALDLLNRKDAEIERLQKENHFKELEIEAFVEMFGECRAGAIKEFAERLKECRVIQTANMIGYIDNLVKEMTNDLKE